MSAQTTYQYNTPPGVAGGLLDIAPYSVDSRSNGEDSADALRYGFGAMQGATPGQDVLAPKPGDTAATFEGLVLTGFTKQMDMDGAARISPLDTVGILRYGKAWGRIVDGIDVAYGEKLYLVTSGDDAGKFTNTSTDSIAISGRFISEASDGIASIELYNAPQA